jgi:hypothetical protein
MSASGNRASTYLTKSSGFDPLIEFLRKSRRYISAGFEQRAEPSKPAFFASDMDADSLTEAEILYISLIGMCM